MGPQPRSEWGVPEAPDGAVVRLPLLQRFYGRVGSSCLAFRPSFHRSKESFLASLIRVRTLGLPVRTGAAIAQAGLPSLVSTRLKYSPLAPRALPRFSATMGCSEFRLPPPGELCIPRWGCPRPEGSGRGARALPLTLFLPHAATWSHSAPAFAARSEERRVGKECRL